MQPIAQRYIWFPGVTIDMAKKKTMAVHLGMRVEKRR
jgi:hypothetical protein